MTGVNEINTDRLVQLAQAGDETACRELFTRFRSRLKRMIATFLDPRVSARVDPSDVLQETLANAAARLPAYLNDRAVGFYPWLRQIAKDRIIDTHRKHIGADKRSVQRENRFDLYVSSASASRLVDRLAGNESSPSMRMTNRERHIQIMAAIERIGETHRDVLLMRFVEQLSVQEIAEVTEMSESAVRSKIWRALEKLSLYVDSPLEDSP